MIMVLNGRVLSWIWKTMSFSYLHKVLLENMGNMAHQSPILPRVSNKGRMHLSSRDNDDRCCENIGTFCIFELFCYKTAALALEVYVLSAVLYATSSSY